MKYSVPKVRAKRLSLLIAPEGIEIENTVSLIKDINILLIAPEGIEIRQGPHHWPSEARLLIAPEGIEI